MNRNSSTRVCQRILDKGCAYGTHIRFTSLIHNIVLVLKGGPDTPTSKNKLKRVDLELFIRFLTVISETVTIGITRLQMKTGTNHTVCIKYVTFLEKLELVKSVIHEDSKHIQITEKGKESLRIVSSYFQ